MKNRYKIQIFYSKIQIFYRQKELEMCLFFIVKNCIKNVHGNVFSVSKSDKKIRGKIKASSPRALTVLKTKKDLNKKKWNIKRSFC